MLINIWISFLFPIVWLWFEQTYVPQLLLHETQPEQKQSSSSAAVFPEHKALPQLKEEMLGGCAVPRHDTAVWHSPAIQRRATGDVLPAVSLQPLWSPRGALDFPPVGFQLLESAGLDTSCVAYAWVPGTSQNSAMPSLHIWSYFEEVGLQTVIFWWGRWWPTTFSLLLSKDLILPNFSWKFFLKRSKNFLSFSPVPMWFCWNQPVHPGILPSPPLFLSGEVPANKRIILLPSLTQFAFLNIKIHSISLL